MRTLSLLAVALIAAACASHETQAPATTAGTNAGNNAASSTAGTATPNNSSSVNGNETAQAAMPKGSVYFDFDSNEVKDQYQPLIQSEARFMQSHSGAKLRIEGNCDERGSREYNLALGQRRAEAVKRIMTVLGANATHIETVSYGEEKPVATGHDEADWAKNRRDDFDYLSR